VLDHPDSFSEGDVFAVVEDGAGTATTEGRPSKIAIIDDDEAVHEGTRFALEGYELNGRGLAILSAYSAAQARELLADNPDTAVVLLDVVMETDRAGLDLVGFIRNELGNDTVRIILRTGQPGQAPEREVILRYDINDYKAKTELTADRLFTALTSALRSHAQLDRIQKTGRKLRSIVEATSTLFQQRSMQALAEGVLHRLMDFTGLDAGGVVVLSDAGEPWNGLVLAGAGSRAGLAGGPGGEALPAELTAQVEALLGSGETLAMTEGGLALRLSTEGGRSLLVLLEGMREDASEDRMLLELFADRLGAAFDTMALQDELRQANAQLEQRVAQRTRELVTANRRLEAQWARARRANAFQNEILGIVAHDLKNPLSVIMGRTEILRELLEEGRAPADPALTQIDRIRESARQLTTMVDSLIKDAMADASDIPVYRERADLGALVREAVEANRPLADRKDQALNVRVQEGIVVACDHERMREAVDNLVSNAVKYSPPGGSILVSVEQQGRDAHVRVADSGPGLQPEDFPRLFGRFQRLSARPTGGENSTGLGLFIAKRIVELHGGRVEVQPGPGKGTVFSIVVGLAQGEEAAA
jgi:signal transduction histidine kinase